MVTDHHPGLEQLLGTVGEAMTTPGLVSCAASSACCGLGRTSPSARARRPFPRAYFAARLTPRALLE